MQQKISSKSSLLHHAVIAQTIMPIPVDYGDGHLSSQLAISMWIVLNIFIVISLLIRFLLVKKDKRFLYQLPIKNFFYELNDDSIEKQNELSGYDWYVHCKPNFNAFVIGLIIINVLGSTILLSIVISKWL